MDSYETDFVVVAHELHADGRVERARFRSKQRFEREPLEPVAAPDGVLLADERFSVRALALDHHGIASLAFRFDEGTHINVWKNRLEALKLPTGPWLTELKRNVRANAPDDMPVPVRWRTREGVREAVFPLGQLKQSLLEFVPGQRLGYVTDVAGHAANRARMIEFFNGVELLYIEAVFLAEDQEHADTKAHLTAQAAGEIAREARVRTAVPFHFSTRYMDREADIRAEFARAWGAGQATAGIAQERSGTH